MRPREFAVIALVLASAAGCGAEFDPPSELKTLRVLGVQKSAPYAKPGEQVELQMLWHDGSTQAPRPVQIGWFSGCFNPPGDLYAGCFVEFATAGPPGPGGPPGFDFGVGNRFSFTMPADVISSRPPPPNPKQPAYGLSFVFFAACAGQLGPPPESDEVGFPVACYGSDDELLGAEDFVAGFSAVYAYDGYRNQNAIVSGFRVNGQEAKGSCVDGACVDTPLLDALSCDSVPCVAACPDDGTEDCPEISIGPIVDPASAEVDQISVDAYGKNYEEQMWIRYYVDRGGVKSDLRLLNDAKTGWNGDYGTKLFAPKKPGPMTVWAVVHDNRGGSAWARQQILVQ